MIPPFEITSYYADSINEKIKVLFLSEGIVSEKYFYQHLFSDKSNGFANNETYILKELTKVGAYEGITEPLLLTKKAIEWCNDPSNNFDINRDRIIITFDLDKLNEKDIIELANIKTQFIIYAFTNPKFELVQLLAFIDDLSDLEEKYKNAGFPNKVLEKAFSNITHVNSKSRRSGKIVADNYKVLLSNHNYDEDDILKAKDNFCTSVTVLLNKIIDNKLDN